MSIVYVDDLVDCQVCGGLLGGSGAARGLCVRCYRRHYRAGTVGQFALRPTRAEAEDGTAENQRGFAPFVDMPWAVDAACAETDPEAWFPEKGGSTREAKAICAECLVRAECLDYALETRQRFGVWGMRSERERRELLGLPEGDDGEESSAA